MYFWMCAAGLQSISSCRYNAARWFIFHISSWWGPHVCRTCPWTNGAAGKLLTLKSAYCVSCRMDGEIRVKWMRIVMYIVFNQHFTETGGLNWLGVWVGVMQGTPIAWDVFVFGLPYCSCGYRRCPWYQPLASHANCKLTTPLKYGLSPISDWDQKLFAYCVLCSCTIHTKHLRLILRMLFVICKCVQVEMLKQGISDPSISLTSSNSHAQSTGGPAISGDRDNGDSMHDEQPDFFADTVFLHTKFVSPTLFYLLLSKRLCAIAEWIHDWGQHNSHKQVKCSCGCDKNSSCSESFYRLSSQLVIICTTWAIMIHAFFLFTLTTVKWHLFGNISDRGYVLVILGYESQSAPWVRFNAWRIHFPCTYQTPFFGETQLCIIHLHSFPYVIKRRASNRACWRRAPHVAGKGLFHLLENRLLLPKWRCIMELLHPWQVQIGQEVVSISLCFQWRWPLRRPKDSMRAIPQCWNNFLSRSCNSSDHATSHFP